MQTTIQDPRIASIEDMLTLELSVAAIENINSEQWENLESILGTSWEPSMIEGTKSVNGEATTKAVGTSGRVRLPLSMVVRPEILTTLKEHFKGNVGGAGTLGDGSAIGKEAQSMYDMSKEDFLAMMGQIGNTSFLSKGKKKKTDGGGFRDAETHTMGKGDK